MSAASPHKKESKSDDSPSAPCSSCGAVFDTVDMRKCVQCESWRCLEEDCNADCTNCSVCVYMICCVAEYVCDHATVQVCSKCIGLTDRKTRQELDELLDKCLDPVDPVDSGICNVELTHK